jgi:hypothetical protein
VPSNLVSKKSSPENIHQRGVILDSKFTFNEHIKYFRNKAQKMLGFYSEFAKTSKMCLNGRHFSLILLITVRRGYSGQISTFSLNLNSMLNSMPKTLSKRGLKLICLI